MNEHHPSNETTIESFEVAPYGSEFTTEEQLTPQEIIHFKERFNANPFLLADLCATMAFNVTLEDEAEALEEKAAIEAQGGAYGTNAIYETREQLALNVARLAAHYAQHLQIAVNLEGSKWPKSMSPPILFATALQDMDEAATQQSQLPDTNE